MPWEGINLIRQWIASVLGADCDRFQYSERHRSIDCFLIFSKTAALWSFTSESNTIPRNYQTFLRKFKMKQSTITHENSSMPSDACLLWVSPDDQARNRVWRVFFVRCRTAFKRNFHCLNVLWGWREKSFTTSTTTLKLSPLQNIAGGKTIHEK